jgi:hypothetical protein
VRDTFQRVRRMKEALEQPFWSTLQPDLTIRLWKALRRPGAPLSKCPISKLVVRERRGAALTRAPRPPGISSRPPAPAVLTPSLPQVCLGTPAPGVGSKYRASP